MLTAAGIPFETHPADVDESLRAGESPLAYVQRVASDKAHVISRVHPRRLILAADTAVVVDARVLGKPVDAADAHRMLRLLSGRAHDVITGLALASDSGIDVKAETTRVEFADLSDDEIRWYVATGEPMDKAGAYAIQGLASRFVTRIEGSYSNVVGLPIALVYAMVKPRLR